MKRNKDPNKIYQDRLVLGKLSVTVAVAVVMSLAFSACNPPEYETIETSLTESTVVTGSTETEVTETSVTATPTPKPTETTAEPTGATTTENTEAAETTTAPINTPTNTPKPTNNGGSSGGGSSSGGNSSGGSGSGNSDPKPTETNSTDPVHVHDYNDYVGFDGDKPYGRCSCGDVTYDTSKFNAPKPTDTPAPTPTPKPAVAAMIKVTYNVSGIDNPSAEGGGENVTVRGITRTYTCQPRSGAKYHSSNPDDYSIPKADVNDLYAEFNKAYPNGAAHAFSVTGTEIVSFCD